MRSNGTRGASQNNGPWEPTAEQLEVYAAVCRGDRTYQEIGNERGISKQAVYKLTQRINAWLWPQIMDDIREIKAQQTESLMHIFTEAMKAWERSKLPAKSRTVKHSTGGEKPGTDKTRNTKGQVGNSAFLSEARAALADIRKIWGADAPVQIDQGGGEGRVAGVPREVAIQQQIQRMQAALAPQEN